MIFGTGSGQRTVLFSRQSERRSEDKPELPRHVYLYGFFFFFFASGRSTVSICRREGKKNIVDLRRKGKLNSEEVGKVGGEG